MIFLSREEVLRIHELLLELYGGASGLRDPGLLDSALARPAASIEHEDLTAQAAA